MAREAWQGRGVRRAPRGHLAGTARDHGRARRAGISIYLWGETVFAQLECDDFDALAGALVDDPVSLAWEEQFADILEFPNADPASGWPERLREVWSL